MSQLLSGVSTALATPFTVDDRIHTEDSTITQIAGELGIHEATLTAWCKAAGVSIRHRRSVATPAGAGGRAETRSRSWSGCVRRTSS